MSKHTPGPWTACGLQVSAIDAGEAICRMVQGNTIPATCLPDLGCERWSEHVANASLIAAAPDLMEALESARQQLAGLHAAITDMGLAGRFVDEGINMISEGRTAIKRADAAIAKAVGGAQ